jgi:restriction system protein
MTILALDLPLGGKVVIQAKRYRHTVGVSAVRDLYGTMMSEGANKGILVTTSGYGPDAFDFAKDKPIELIDGGGLLYLLVGLLLKSYETCFFTYPRP